MKSIKKEKGKKGKKKGGGGTNVEKSNFVHTVLAAMQQVQFLFEFFFDFVGMNKRPTTVV